MQNIIVPGKNNFIYTDNPWAYDNEKSSNPSLGGMTYNTVSIDDLIAMKPFIDELAAPDCLLFMWCTRPKRYEADLVMKEWGFEYVTTPFTWVKLNETGEVIQQGKDLIIKGGIYSGLGHHTCGNTEQILMGRRKRTKGSRNIPRLDKSVKEVVFAPKSRHSEKPQIFKRKIEQVWGCLPRVELFARKRFNDGWAYWGEEVWCDYDYKLIPGGNNG